MQTQPPFADEDAAQRLARNRVRIGELLTPAFPRSRTMRLLLARGGTIGLIAIGAALFAAKPAAGARFLRWAPIARALLRALR